MIENLNPGADSSSPGQITALPSMTLFAAGHRIAGWEACGTAATTEMLADIRRGRDSSYPHEYASLRDVAAFVADDGFGNARLEFMDLTTNSVELVGPALKQRLRQ